MEQSSSSQRNQIEQYEQGIPITSESHWSLFCHDEEIIRHFQDQIGVLKQHISALEEVLQNTTKNYEFTRNQLYDSEEARYNEADARMALQRHLRLEQNSRNEWATAYESLQREYMGKAMDVERLCSLNERLQHDIQHEHKISRYENAAQQVSTIAPSLVWDVQSYTPLLPEGCPRVFSKTRSQAVASPHLGTQTSLQTFSQGSILDLDSDRNTQASETILHNFKEVVYMESSQSSPIDPKVEPPKEPKGPKRDVSMGQRKKRKILRRQGTI